VKKLFVLLVIFALVFAACGDEDSQDKGNEDNTKTTLTIYNMSSYNLLNVEYSSVEFGTINSGKDTLKEVNTGTRYIFFSLQIRDEEVSCRTTQVLTCNEGNNEITFTNNTSITTAIGERTNTIKSIVDTLTAEKGFMIGDTGPGGGIVFYAQGGQYKECSGELGSDEWDNAVNVAKNYRGGGFTDWQLPNRGELDLIYQNLHRKKLGGFSQDGYWTSQEYDSYNAWIQNFSSIRINILYIEDGYYESYYTNAGEQDWVAKDESYRVRAVRSFSQ